MIQAIINSEASPVRLIETRVVCKIRKLIIRGNRNSQISGYQPLVLKKKKSFVRLSAGQVLSRESGQIFYSFLFWEKVK